MLRIVAVIATSGRDDNYIQNSRLSCHDDKILRCEVVRTTLVA